LLDEYYLKLKYEIWKYTYHINVQVYKQLLQKNIKICEHFEWKI